MVDSVLSRKTIHHLPLTMLQSNFCCAEIKKNRSN